MNSIILVKKADSEAAVVEHVAEEHSNKNQAENVAADIKTKKQAEEDAKWKDYLKKCMIRRLNRFGIRNVDAIINRDDKNLEYPTRWMNGILFDPRFKPIGRQTGLFEEDGSFKKEVLDAVGEKKYTLEEALLILNEGN